MLPNPTADPAAANIKPTRPEKLPRVDMIGGSGLSIEKSTKYGLNFNNQKWVYPFGRSLPGMDNFPRITFQGNCINGKFETI
jgi:hypothetical protein